MRKRAFFFFVPAGILIGFGIWIIGFNVVNYLHQIGQISSSERFCNGIQCVCTNLRCTTKNDLTIPYGNYFSWGIGLVSLGVIILVFSKRWWKKKITIITLVLFLIGISFGVLTLYDFLSNIPVKEEPLMRGWYTSEQYNEYLVMMQERTYLIITFSFLISGSVLLFIKNRGRLR